uniref:DDE-1 domain-containing protein n=1 Tax=Macrostomum lignano TaxID=282301 RepID=A0A1I8FJR9_9PLAT
NNGRIRKKAGHCWCDGACGKTCLLIVFSKETSSLRSYVPTVFENYVADIEVDGKQLALWDTGAVKKITIACGPPLSYPDTGRVILMCFAIDSPELARVNIPTSARMCPSSWLANKRGFAQRREDSTRKLAKMRQEAGQGLRTAGPWQRAN